MDKSLAQQIVEVIGVTIANGIAAFFGSVGALAFMKDVKPVQALFAVFCGLGLGSYGGAAIVAYFQWPPVAAGFASFLGGFLAIPLLGFVFAFVSRWRAKADSIADRAADKVLPPGGAPPEPPGPTP